MMIMPHSNLCRILANRPPFRKNNGNKNNKNIFNKNGERCKDVKTQKTCEQGWKVNIGPKIKQTTSI